MMLSPHFALSEFTTSHTASSLGLDNTPPAAAIDNLRRTAQLLEEIRLVLKAPILVTSGYRSEQLNAMVGGAGASAHLDGRAADFICPGYGQPLAVCQAIAAERSLIFDQLIFEYGAWTHVAWSAAPRCMAFSITHDGTTMGFPDDRIAIA